ncbi:MULTISPECIES: hypothetical protein [unclassified Desulfovibrio]|uniref:hypothetical protein n=1 Tax=unclassified Desulfovibrio TaxID=2593640 RepID=UPI002FDA5291
MMYPRFVFCLLALCLTVFAAPAAAKTYDLAFISADIPDACHFMTRDGAVFVLDDEDHFFTLNIVERDKSVSLEEYAQKLSRSINGGPVSKAGEDAWTFLVKVAVVPFNVLVMGNDEHVAELFTDQNRAEWPKDIKSALDSIKGKTPALDSLLQKLLAPRQP